MKKILICLGLIFAAATANAQTPAAPLFTSEQIAASKEVNDLSAKIVKLFVAKQYEEAQPLALKAVALAETNRLFDSGRNIAALTNLAEIYFARSKEGEAAALYERALALYEKTGGAASLDAAKTAERLAFIYGLKNNFGKAERAYLKALTAREAVQGANSAAVVKLLGEIAEFYRYADKTEKAEAFHQRAVSISDQIFKPEDSEYGKAYSRYSCFVSQQKTVAEAAKYLETFDKTRNIKYPYEAKPQTSKTLRGGVVNGKAAYLAKPPYPEEAKQARLSGVVMIEVLIDESGKVVSAERTCGYDVLAKDAIRAALESRFTPTLLSGVPVKVIGVIVYNFNAR